MTDGIGRAEGAWEGPERGAGRDSTARVMRPDIVEEVEFDVARISALFSDLGARGARSTILRAVDALTERLAALDAAPEGDLAARGQAARRLVGIAEGVGMATLAQAARAAADAAAQGDRAAEAATTARLVRVGDLSLAAIEEVSGTAP